MWTAVLVACNMHESKYTVSDIPDRASVEGKSILMIDDASISGGTFRAAAKELRRLGATRVRGLAMCGNNVSHVWDPDLEGKVDAQIIDQGMFTPWGTY